MARYKDVHYDQDKFIAVSFRKQILPGTFEYTLSYLIDHELDVSLFDARYRNDETGAPAFDPAVRLKIILYAYSRDITSSRKIEQACRENIMFMALSADTQPHFHDDCRFYLDDGRADDAAVSQCVDDLRRAEADRRRHVCRRRVQAAEQCFEELEWHQVGAEAEKEEAGASRPGDAQTSSRQ